MPFIVFSPSIGKPEYEPTCGRPLGIHVDNGHIYVLDSYLGLFEVEDGTGMYNQSLMLASKKVEIFTSVEAFRSIMFVCKIFLANPFVSQNNGWIGGL